MFICSYGVVNCRQCKQEDWRERKRKADRIRARRNRTRPKRAPASVAAFNSPRLVLANGKRKLPSYQFTCKGGAVNGPCSKGKDCHCWRGVLDDMHAEALAARSIELTENAAVQAALAVSLSADTSQVFIDLIGKRIHRPIESAPVSPDADRVYLYPETRELLNERKA